MEFDDLTLKLIEPGLKKSQNYFEGQEKGWVEKTCPTRCQNLRAKVSAQGRQKGIKE